MGSLEELCLLTDDDVETLCKVTHHAGGTTNDDNLPTPETGLHPQIANLGIPVTQCTKNNLKLATYYLKYKGKTSRVVTLAGITISNICELREHHDWEASHQDVELPELTLNCPRNMENLEEYFCSCLGVKGIPLAYTMRENPEVVPEADGPVENYASRQDELIAHEPILTVANPNAFTATYLAGHQHI